jgi:hypothetical protein
VSRRMENLDALAREREHVAMDDVTVHERARALAVHDPRDTERVFGGAIEHQMVGVRVGLEHHTKNELARRERSSVGLESLAHRVDQRGIAPDREEVRLAVGPVELFDLNGHRDFPLMSGARRRVP